MKSLENQMLDAAELFHYAHRFRDALFVFVLNEDTEFERLITDIRVLASSRIRAIFFCLDQPDLAAQVSFWGIRGAPFRYLSQGEHVFNPNKLQSLVEPLLGQGLFPVIGLNRMDHAHPSALFALSKLLHADKVFLLSEFRGLEVNGRILSHVTPSDWNSLLGSSQINIGTEKLSEIYRLLNEFGIEIVLLDGAPGSIFQEIFTHRGRGTLFSENYPNIIRRAEPKDTHEIMLILRAHFESGALLVLNEEEIANTIEDFFVYSVNGAIVATTKLVRFGDSAELAKFVTLARYQGRGRARELAIHMIGEAKAIGLRRVFALSIEERMWAFFRNLGFKEVARESLPEEWQQHYDFARPSRAFEMQIG